MSGDRSPSTGHGLIEFVAMKMSSSDTQQTHEKMIYQKSHIVSMKHTYPLRFLVPENSTPGVCRWIYPLIFGGGLVGGDQIKYMVTLGTGCAAVVSSQDSTKVYHCNNGSLTTQEVTYNLADGSLLCVLQDPLVCFQNANFCQKQVTNLL